MEENSELLTGVDHGEQGRQEVDGSHNIHLANFWKLSTTAPGENVETNSRLSPHKVIHDHMKIPSFFEDQLNKLKESTRQEDKDDATFLYTVFSNELSTFKYRAGDVSDRVHEKTCGGLNALHLAIVNGQTDFVEEILKRPDKQKWLQSTFGGYGPLHVAVYYKREKILDLILKAASEEKEPKDCTTFLNKKSSNASGPDYSALHVAAIQNVPSATLRLLGEGADVNATLKGTNHTPLHLAALCESEETAVLLLQNGASAWAELRDGRIALEVAAERVPGAVRAFLDSLVTYDEDKKELRLNFSKLQPLRCDCSKSVLSAFVDCDHFEFLKHPVCQKLIEQNWTRLRWWYFARMIVCWVMLVVTTVHMVGFHTQVWAEQNNWKVAPGGFCQPPISNNSKFQDGLLQLNCYLVTCFTPLDMLRKLSGFYIFTDLKKVQWDKVASALRRSARQPNNYLEWFCLVSTAVLLVTGPSVFSVISPLVVLLFWLDFMILLGLLPMFGAYMEMFTAVLWQFVKLVMAYVCMLIGYTVAFYIIFKRKVAFSGPVKALSKTIAMMTGEFEFGDLFGDDDGWFHIVNYWVAQAVFISFIVAVAIILMNLLIGIVVDDVRGIRAKASLSKLKRKVTLVEYLESVAKSLSAVWKTPPQQDDETSGKFEKCYTVEGKFKDDILNKAMKIALREEERNNKQEYCVCCKAHVKPLVNIRENKK